MRGQVRPAVANMRESNDVQICLLACELNPPYAIGANLRTPGPISRFADLRYFAFFDDMNAGGTFLLHDALRIVPAGRGKDVGLRLDGKSHEAACGGFTLQGCIVSAGGYAHSGDGQSAGPDKDPDAQRSGRYRETNGVISRYLIEAQKVSSSSV